MEIYKSGRVHEVLIQDTYRGYEYVIVTYGSHPCAYVEIPKKSKNYEKEYADIDINVHGGLTFSDYLTGVRKDLTGWYIGWDYSHFGDFTCYAEDIGNFGERKYTLNEIEIDCKDVINQLIHLEEKDTLENQELIKKAEVCVKACEGITTEALKAGIVKFTIDEAFKEMNRRITQELKQEDSTFLGIKIWEK